MGNYWLKRDELDEKVRTMLAGKRPDERRVFYVDLSNLPPEETEKFLENLRERFKQRNCAR